MKSQMKMGLNLPDTIVTLTAALLRQRVPAAGTLRERALVVMRAARDRRSGDTWLCTDDDQRFRSAVGALLLTCSDAERALIGAEMHALRAVAAATNGIPVDFSAIAFPTDPVGLLPIWRESASQPGANTA